MIWLWALTLVAEVKMACRLHQGSSRVDASTQAARSKLRATVTNRCATLRRLSRNISESRCLAAFQLMHVGNLHGRAYHVTSLSLGRDPQSSPLLCIGSSHFLTVLLFLLYYSLTITQCVTVCHRPRSSWCTSVLQVRADFLGGSVFTECYGAEWMDGWLKKLKK